jgi:hypothetical protein
MTSRPDDPLPAADSPAREAEPQPSMPEYRGAPLDPDRGPGLGCFWVQVALLAVLLVLTPLTVILAMEPWISALLLGLTLLLLLFVGQTTIFLLRLVAADRRSTRRQPLSQTARRTVGQLEDEAAPEQPADEQDARASNEDDARAG